jgi:hypothetical protein
MGHSGRDDLISALSQSFECKLVLIESTDDLVSEAENLSLIFLLDNDRLLSFLDLGLTIPVVRMGDELQALHLRCSVNEHRLLQVPLKLEHFKTFVNQILKSNSA